ncbi:MAG: hypothetical protein QM742_07920 [Aquabacterium sp.]
MADSPCGFPSGWGPSARTMRLGAGVGGAFLCMLLAACSPELNWRTVQVESAHGLTAMFPCKPDRFERKVPWPGLPSGVTMRLLSCRAQGHTWALSSVTMPDVTLAEPALRQWPDIMRHNLTQAASGDPSGLRMHDLGSIDVPRMTPSRSAHAWYFEGPARDGSGQAAPVGILAWHFFHGMTVFQASVTGEPRGPAPQSSEDVAHAFFHSFQFPG